MASGLLPGRSCRPPQHFILTGSERIFQTLGLIQIGVFSLFLFSFGWGFCFGVFFGGGWAWGLFPTSGTGALSAFPYAFFSGPGEQRLVMGGFAYVSHANIVFSCTERHSNH